MLATSIGRALSDAKISWGRWLKGFLLPRSGDVEKPPETVANATARS
jgi:hypothetical protein